MNCTKIKSNWKKKLKLLKLENIKIKSPGFFELSGGYEMKVNPYSDKTSNGLTKCIVDYLTFNGHYANRINVQGQARKERVQLAFGNYRDILKFTPSTTNRGTSDIHSIIKGQHVSIEVKAGKDRMSLNQLKEMERVTNAGGRYFIARDMESFVTWYKENF